MYNNYSLSIITYNTIIIIYVIYIEEEYEIYSVLLTFPFGFFLFGETIDNSSGSEISPKSLMMKKKCLQKL